MEMFQRVAAAVDAEEDVLAAGVDEPEFLYPGAVVRGRLRWWMVGQRVSCLARTICVSIL
jgi:hypothetical protein